MVERRMPRPRSYRLDDLAPGLRGDLAPRETVEGLRFDRLDLDALDLTASTVRECLFAGGASDRVDGRGLRLIECELRTLDLTIAAMPETEWRDVALVHVRVGSAEWHGARWNAVEVRDCRLAYANVRGATLEDVQFVDCTIDELDLTEATATRVAFSGTTVGMLRIGRARLADVDLTGAELRGIEGVQFLRGARISGVQLSELAPLLAAELGLQID